MTNQFKRKQYDYRIIIEDLGLYYHFGLSYVNSGLKKLFFGGRECCLSRFIAFFIYMIIFKPIRIPCNFKYFRMMNQSIQYCRRCCGIVKTFCPHRKRNVRCNYRRSSFISILAATHPMERHFLTLLACETASEILQSHSLCK